MTRSLLNAHLERRDVDLAVKPLTPLLGAGRLEEELDRLGQVPARLLDGIPLAGDVQLGTQGHEAVTFAKLFFVLLLLGSANRDPRQFPDPDRLDLRRSDNRHLAFSQGVHFCLGAQLARAEAEIALTSLLRRFPDLAGNPNPPGWRRSIVLRGPLSLPISL